MIFIWLLILACDVGPRPSVTPKDRHIGCHSKKQGSTPACWAEQDWQVYCERVECKQQIKETK